MKSPLVTRSASVAPLLSLLLVAGALAVAACGAASTATNNPASPVTASTSGPLPSAAVAEATKHLEPLSHARGLIAFVKVDGGGYGSDSSIYVVRPDGTGLKRLTHLDSQAGVFPGKPAWSPDGRRIAFLSGSAVWVMNADGSDRRQVTEPRPGLRVNGLAWSPDGGRIVLTLQMVGDNRYGPVGLAVMNADGTGFTRLLWEGPSMSYDNPVWAPNGRIFFARRGEYGLREISSIDADGSGLTVVSAAWEDSFSLSPDGKWLLIFEGMEQSAVRMAADGRGREQVVLGKDQWEKYLRGALHWPVASSWSPDGRWVAVAVCGVPTMGLASSGLWVVKSDGYWDPRLLSAAGWTVFDPAWQPQ